MTTTAQPSYQEQALRALNDLPPFSPVLTLLLASLAKEDVSFTKVAALIEKDTVLAGNVLRVVNSALYGCRGTINSVSHAISIMGLVKLRNTALGFSVNRMWKSFKTPRGWSTARFNFHSVATAIMADQIAQNVPVAYPEGAFVAGLFHDLGKLLIATSFCKEYDEVSRAIQSGRGTHIQCEKEIFGIDHAELAAAALDRWNLPVQVQRAVLFHHDPAAAPRSEYDGCRYHLAHVIRAATDTATALGATVGPPPKDFVAPDRFPALEQMGLGEKIPAIIAEFRGEYDQMGAAF